MPDAIGLEHAGAAWLLPLLVAAMSFLGALALAGMFGSAALAGAWGADAANSLTIQLPDASQTPAILALLNATPGVSGARALSAADINALLTPWLGADSDKLGLAIPAVITASYTGDMPALLAKLQASAPGISVDSGAAWAARVAVLTTSLRACAAAILVIVAAVAAAIVALATRAGLAQQRETIDIIHSLGALDETIARRLAIRATVLTAAGALAGVVLALPVLGWLAGLAAPFLRAGVPGGGGFLSAGLLASLPALPLAAAGLGWGTAQWTVRGWLRRLA
jgi:cell division transport system permease protein